jgi:PAS domain S-box-containing protein
MGVFWNKSLDRLKSLRAVYVLLAGSILVLTVSIILGGFVWLRFRDLTDRARHELQLEKLAANILHLDYVLTWSARSAAQSGDPQWEVEYRTYEPQLAAAIAELKREAPSIHQEATAAEIGDANQKLLEVEARTLRLAREGHLAAARELISAREYNEQKHRYGDAMLRVFTAIELETQSRISTYQRSVTFAGSLGLVGLILLLFVTPGVVLIERRRSAERERADRALRESEAKFRALTDSAASAIFISQGDIIVYANRQIDAITGYSAEEFIGRNFWDLIHPDFLDLVRTRRAARLAGGAVPSRYEFKIHARDGAERWIDFTASLFEYQGRPAVLGTAFDITARKEAEAELRRTNETLQTVIHTSPLPIVAVDSQGLVQLWNKAAEEIFGWTAAEVRGRPLPTIPDSDRESFLAHLHSELRGEPYPPQQLRRLRKDGSLVDVSLWTAPLRDASGRIGGAMGIFEDITQRKRLEEQLRQSQKMEAIGGLAGGIAHDFNNLLGVIIGFSEIQLEQLGPADPTRKSIQEILKAAKRAATLTRQLLAFSRRQVLEPRVVDLNALVSEMQKLLLRLIGEDVQLVTAFDPHLGHVKVDPGQIDQVMMNLVVNARDAMPQGGKITIETRNIELDEAYGPTHAGAPSGRYVMLAVSDTGLGMDPETRARIFEPFFTTKERGTGLGLATVYGIVKQSGGYIWVYSEPANGTTFKIYFPRVDAPPSAEPLEARPAPLVGSETILLVEDDDGLRELISAFLQTGGYVVLEAARAQHALELARRHAAPIHLLVTDVIMPDMNGRALAESLVAVRPEVEVLFMSGYTDDTIVRHGVLEQNVAFLQKPFSRDAFLRKVRETLDVRRSGPPPS